MSKLAEVQKRLDELEAKRIASQSFAHTNRTNAIKVIRFIIDTIGAIDPERIGVSCYGSYTNSQVGDYPNLTIHAVYASNHVATWRINAGGDVPPQITSDDIVSAVLDGLQKISPWGSSPYLCLGTCMLKTRFFYSFKHQNFCF